MLQREVEGREREREREREKAFVCVFGTNLNLNRRGESFQLGLEIFELAGSFLNKKNNLIVLRPLGFFFVFLLLLLLLSVASFVFDHIINTQGCS